MQHLSYTVQLALVQHVCGQNHPYWYEKITHCRYLGIVDDEVTIARSDFPVALLDRVGRRRKMLTRVCAASSSYLLPGRDAGGDVGTLIEICEGEGLSLPLPQQNSSGLRV